MDEQCLPQDEKLSLRKDLFARPGSQEMLKLQKKPAILIAERDDTLRRKLKDGNWLLRWKLAPDPYFPPLFPPSQRR